LYLNGDGIDSFDCGTVSKTADQFFIAGSTSSSSIASNAPTASSFYAFYDSDGGFKGGNEVI